MASEFPSLTAADMKASMLSSATPVAKLQGYSQTGVGQEQPILSTTGLALLSCSNLPQWASNKLCIYCCTVPNGAAADLSRAASDVCSAAFQVQLVDVVSVVC